MNLLTAVLSGAVWVLARLGLALLAVSAALSAFVSLGGAAANLLFPRLDAENDTIVCKQSLSAMIGVLGGMALAGAGIGLYLARQIAAGQGGYIRVKSAPGQGSVFSLYLPRRGKEE